jgi:plasmid stabilization system protein ParE
MKIRYKASFINRLEKQIEYIAKDNHQAAINFRDELMERIQQILQNPYLYRKSVYFNDPSIRDLIFKGYTIVFRISNKYIEVFGFVKYRKKP